MFNNKEIGEVINYINKLLTPIGRPHQIVHVEQSDIGIVTPYKMQCKKISQACRNRNWNKITIGTSEVFQGKEKPIMIVSTVRAGGKYLGFVNDPRVSIPSFFLCMIFVALRVKTVFLISHPGLAYRNFCKR